MLDTTFSTYQRSRGTARVSLKASGQIETLYQAGSAKAMIPRSHGPCPEVVFLNTSGGLTGGDRLEFQLKVSDEATALAATQTAERAYASPGGAPAKVKVDITVGKRATVFWLPQETILFDRSALDRETTVHLGEGARFLGIETIVLGRAHMGERVQRLEFRDVRRMFDSVGSPLHAEQIALDDDVLKRRADPVSLQNATVFSTVTYLGPDASDKLSTVRDLLEAADPRLAVSGWDKRLIIRALGEDSWSLRAALVPALKYLTNGPLPRVWQL